MWGKFCERTDSYLERNDDHADPNVNFSIFRRISKMLPFGRCTTSIVDAFTYVIGLKDSHMYGNKTTPACKLISTRARPGRHIGKLQN